MTLKVTANQYVGYQLGFCHFFFFILFQEAFGEYKLLFKLLFKRCWRSVTVRKFVSQNLFITFKLLSN